MLDTVFRPEFLDNLLLGMEAAVAFFVGLVFLLLAVEAVLGPLIDKARLKR